MQLRALGKGSCQSRRILHRGTNVFDIWDRNAGDSFLALKPPKLGVLGLYLFGAYLARS